jgi:hypothetical protein
MLRDEGGVGTTSVSATVRRTRSSVGGRRVTVLGRAAAVRLAFGAVDRCFADAFLAELVFAFLAVLAVLRPVARRRAVDFAFRAEVRLAFFAVFLAARPRLAFFLAMSVSLSR